MKIILIKEKGIHESNYLYSEAENFKRAFSRLHISLMIWGPRYIEYESPLSYYVEPDDIIFVLENYPSSNWIPDLKQFKNLKIFWSIDSHCVLQQHLNFCNSQDINILLNSTSRYIQYFQSQNRSCYWFPNCCPSDLICPLSIEKINDVGFCGNIGNRGNFIQEISNRFNMKKDIMVIGHKMVEAINSYKIHFNRNISDDINFRTFETLGCKTFLLTNETDKLKDLYEIGKHLITYDTINDCFDKIQYYLSNPEERERIALNGYNHTIKNHTYDKRAKELLSYCRGDNR